jgi:hypothetical protein
MNIHAFSGIRTRDPSNQAAAQLRLRPHVRCTLVTTNSYFECLWIVSGNSALFIVISHETADPSGRAVQGEGLRPFVCCSYGFESRWGHGCLSLISVECCQVEVSVLGWSLVQRSPTKCGVSECDREASIMRRLSGPLGVVAPWEERKSWGVFDISAGKK